MRIKTINDLVANRKTDVFYVCLLCKEVLERYNTSYIPPRHLMDKCRIIPCKMILERNTVSGGYRMTENEGESFSSEESLQYKFVSLTYKEAKKYKLPDNIHEYNKVYYLPVKEQVFYGLSLYNKLTMHDGTRYSTYTENHLENITEDQSEQGDNYKNDKEDHIYYGSDLQIRVFTDLYEAQHYLNNTLKDIIDNNIKELDRETNNLKRDYYMFENCVKNNSISLY